MNFDYKKSLVLLFLYVTYGIYDAQVRSLASKTLEGYTFHFVGVLAGGSLTFKNDVIAEARSQIKNWDIKNGLLEELWQ